MPSTSAYHITPLSRLLREARLDQALDPNRLALGDAEPYPPVTTPLSLLMQNARLEQALEQAKSRNLALIALNQIYSRQLEHAHRQKKELARLRQTTQYQRLQHLHSTIDHLETEIVSLQHQLQLATCDTKRWRRQHPATDRQITPLSHRLEDAVADNGLAAENRDNEIHN